MNHITLTTNDELLGCMNLFNMLLQLIKVLYAVAIQDGAQRRRFGSSPMPLSALLPTPNLPVVHVLNVQA
jgi:hypothetical protein